MSAPPLGKHLASTEKKTRDKAIKNLAIFLSDESRDALSKLEMAKLWKGIFYGFWMSDKPLVQQALATELADLVLTITTTSASLAFLRGFWETIVREWNGIDRLRIDKYYMLVRRFVNASFRLLMRAEWDRDTCKEYNDILTVEGGPLCPIDPKVPTSLAYHLADIYVEELDKALGTLSTSASPPLPAPLHILLRPFLSLAAQTSTSVTYKRIQSSLLDPLLSALSPPSDEDEPPAPKRGRSIVTNDASALYPNVVSNSCFNDPRMEGKVEGPRLRKKLLRAVFELASQPETRDTNRRKMYSLWKDGADEDGDDD
ncbi:putative nucleolar protein,Nop52 [Lyophyllum shimeji]|uniref:Nucleolar protein,Nop52 n=1 Tax=Lyophyllum shimeji TaxID=47721 RepID=A0A9P3PI60_LYOSH|nr:putative nucleolar protein,Nop52 [Lyophyllum shimeji]